MGPGYLFGGLVWVWVWGLRESDQRSTDYSDSESIRKSIEPSWNKIYGLGRLGNGCWCYVMNKMVSFPVYIV
jgi:hypothetical protein